ncbi:DUF1656 domain-containing protein [Rhodopseudomonas palustris]|uniref:DUF1656 domain-containing protein n=1 Tax=Rhodopseudomonas palustris TaxID=1076 RepID=UPI00030FE65D
MIVDFDIGGVLIPSLLVIALVALVATVALIRFLAVAGIYRAFVYPSLVELAIFSIVYGLLVEHMPFIGLFK